MHACYCTRYKCAGTRQAALQGSVHDKSAVALESPSWVVEGVSKRRQAGDAAGDEGKSVAVQAEGR